MRLTALLLLLIPFGLFGQSDTVSTRNYQIVDRYPLFQFCKNCKIKSPRPPMACGHSYDVLFAGYSYDKNNWLEIGYNRDIASCYPDKGAHLFSASVIGTIFDNKMVNGVRLAYFRDHLFGFQFYFLKLGLTVESYTDYKMIDYVVRPEIRIGDNMFFSKLLTRLQFSYGYNFKLSDNAVIDTGRHQVSVNIRLRIRGWVS